MLLSAFNLMFHPARQWQVFATWDDKKIMPIVFLPLLSSALPALAWFVGTTQTGWQIGSNVTRLTPASALPMAVCFFIAQILAVWAIGYLIHWMSRTYEGQSSLVRAVAMASLVSFPVMISGVVGFVPNFFIALPLGLLAICYSVYLLYLGTPIVFNIPEERGFLYASAAIGASLTVVVAVMGLSVILWSMGVGPQFTD